MKMPNAEENKNRYRQNSESGEREREKERERKGESESSESEWEKHDFSEWESNEFESSQSESELEAESELKCKTKSEQEMKCDEDGKKMLWGGKEESSTTHVHSDPQYEAFAEIDRQLVDHCPPLANYILKRKTIMLYNKLITLTHFHAGHEHFMRGLESDLMMNREKMTTRYLFLYINKFRKIIHMEKRTKIFIVKWHDIYLNGDDKNIIDTCKNIVAHCETLLTNAKNERKNRNCDNRNSNTSSNSNDNNNNNNNNNSNVYDEEFVHNKKMTSDTTKGLDAAYLITMYEIILKSFPHSYKIWYNYLKDSIELLQDIYYDNSKAYKRINESFELGLRYMYLYPSIRIMYIQFLFIQRRVSAIRRCFNQLLQTTHEEKHSIFWDIILKIAAKIPNLLVHLNYVKRCLIVFPSRKIELFYFNVKHRLYVEAIQTFLEITKDEEFYDLQGKTENDLYNYLFDTLNSRNSLGRRLAAEISKNIPALSKYGSSTALYNLLARDRICNGFYFEVLEVYENAIKKCSDVKEFALIFDSYIETIKALIEIKTKQRKEWFQKLKDGTLSPEDLSGSETDSEEDAYGKSYLKKQLWRREKQNMEQIILYFKKKKKKRKNEDISIMDTDEEDTDEETDEEDNWNLFEKEENEFIEKEKRRRDIYEFNNFNIMIETCMKKIEMLLENRKRYLAEIKLKSNKSNVYLWLNKIEVACSSPRQKVKEYKKCLRYFKRHNYVGKLSDVYISYALHYYKKNNWEKTANIFWKAIKSSGMKTLEELASIFCIWIELNLLQHQYMEALYIARISVDTNRSSWAKTECPKDIQATREENEEKEAEEEEEEEKAAEEEEAAEEKNEKEKKPEEQKHQEEWERKQQQQSQQETENYLGLAVHSDEVDDAYICCSSSSSSFDEIVYEDTDTSERMSVCSGDSDSWVFSDSEYSENGKREDIERILHGTHMRKQKKYYPQFNLLKSVKLVSLVLDMEMNYGTVESAISMFDFMYHAKGITVKMVLTFANFLYKKKYFNEAFKTYEKGISVFRYPYVYRIYIHYINKYIERYKDKNSPYVRELFKQAIYGVDNKTKIPKEFAKTIFLMYVKYEEQYGLTKKALNVYKAAIPFLDEPDKVSFYKILISKVAKTYGIHKCREVFEEAIGTLQDEGARELAIIYIDIEYKLNEYERVRALYIYVAQFTNPEKNASFYQAWREFEALHGDEHTFRDMIRIKKSAQRIFSKATAASKAAGEETTNVIEDGLAGAKKVLTEIIENEQKEEANK